MTTTQHDTQRNTTLHIPVPTGDLMLGVLGAGYSTYEWWTGCDYDMDYEDDRLPPLDNIPYVRLSIIDPDNEERRITKWLSVEDIVQGVNAVVAQCPWVRWDDLDATDADMVLQYAMLGEVIYG